ncbi:MAG: hypothetical protein CL607_17395 [Anaerolineaceae bacterium]|nr:hypothetical protein [Anaerolineaceae bacterium]
MKSRTLWSAIAFIAIACAPVSAQQPSEGDKSEEAVETTGEKSNLDEVICRTSKATGSRVRTSKRCLTRRQWTVEQAQNRRDIDRAQTSRGTSD